MFWKRKKAKDINIDAEKLNETKQEANRKAKEYLQDKEKLENLIKDAEVKAESKDAKKGFVKEVWENLLAMVDLVRAYVKGDYRNIPYKSLVMIVGTIIYFVMPVDAIPDFLAGLGFTDDAAVLAFTMRQVKSDIDKFTEWKKEQN
ncbi:YkvA family protein [Radiobacillus sp. PE A8.2]|uniref:YkvA family protein n=1 Tax=Radiobacillus sp. PE A8.2 TaxID=3380349 RepID=UPI00388DB4B9